MTSTFTNILVSGSTITNNLTTDTLQCNEFNILTTDLSLGGTLKVNNIIPDAGNSMTLQGQNINLNGNVIIGSALNPTALTVYGNTTFIDTTNLDIKDSLVRLNKGGSNITSVGSGLEIEGNNGNIVSFLKTTGSNVASGWIASNSFYSPNITTDYMNASNASLSNVSLSNVTINGNLNTSNIIIKGVNTSLKMGLTPDVAFSNRCSLEMLGNSGIVLTYNTMNNNKDFWIRSGNTNAGLFYYDGYGSLRLTSNITAEGDAKFGTSKFDNHSFNGNVSIGTLDYANSSVLSFPSVSAKKIALYDDTLNNNQYFGFNASSNELGYNLSNINASHKFYYGLTSSSKKLLTTIEEWGLSVTGNIFTNNNLTSGSINTSLISSTTGNITTVNSSSINNTGNIITGNILTTGLISSNITVGNLTVNNPLNAPIINSTSINNTGNIITNRLTANILVADGSTISYDGLNNKIVAYSNSVAKVSNMNFYANSNIVSEVRDAGIEVSTDGISNAQDLGDMAIKAGNVRIGSILSTRYNFINSALGCIIQSPEIYLYGNVAVSKTLTANISSINSNITNLTTSIINNSSNINTNILNSSFINNASNIITGNIISTNLYGTLLTSSQPNITTIGTLNQILTVNSPSTSIDTTCNGLPTGSAGAYHQIVFGGRQNYFSQDATDNNISYLGTAGGSGDDPDFEVAFRKNRGLLLYNATTSAIDAWATGNERLRVVGVAKITGNLSCDNNLTISGNSNLPIINSLLINNTGNIISGNLISSNIYSPIGNITTINNTTLNSSIINSGTINATNLNNITNGNITTINNTTLNSGTVNATNLNNITNGNITTINNTNMNISNALQINSPSGYNSPNSSSFISFIKGGDIINCANIQGSTYQFSSDRVINSTFTNATLVQIAHTTSTTVGFSGAFFLDVVFSVTNTLNQTATRSYQLQMNFVKERGNTICNCSTNIGTASAIASSSGATIGGPNLAFNAIAGTVVLQFTQPTISTGTYAYTTYSYHGRVVVNQLSSSVSHIQNLLTNIAYI